MILERIVRSRSARAWSWSSFSWRCRHVQHPPAPRCHRAVVGLTAANFVVSV